MSEDIQPSRFFGRTYSRARQSAASRAFDEAAGIKSVPFKSAMSISKWGKASNVTVNKDLDDASEPKKIRIQSQTNDPFSFDTEDKRKFVPVKKQEATLQIGKKTAPGQTFLFSGARITTCQDFEKDEDEDDIFSAKLMRIYKGNTVTSADKLDSPTQRRPGYTAKRELRDRIPMIASDPELNEDSKRNYVDQQMKRKSNATVKGRNNSATVSEQELANEDQSGTVICKPKSQLEKYFIKNSKRVENLISITPGRSASEIEGPGGNGNNDLTSVTPDRSEAILTANKAQFQNFSFDLADSSEGMLSPTEHSSNLPSSASTKYVTDRSGCNKAETALSPQSSPSFHNNLNRNGSLGYCGKSYRIFKSRTPQCEERKPPDVQVITTEDNSAYNSSESSLSSQSSLSSDISSHGSGSLGHGGKRYRIFKSRACHVEEEIMPPVSQVTEGDEEFLRSSSKQNIVPSGDSQVSSAKEETILTQIDLALEKEYQSPARSLDSSQSSYFAEPADTAEHELDAFNIKQINPSSARELLAARLRSFEKGKDSDSVDVMDNTSECSEILQSQETPSNSQNILEGGSQKESTEIAPRKFFKSKSLSGPSDLERRILGNNHEKTPTKATYNARSWHSEHESDIDKEEWANESAEVNDGDIILLKKWERGPKLKREVHWPERKHDEAYTSLKVSQKHKKLYTVVHNVKQTHEVQELGETQDFMDEVDYLLDSLRHTNSTSIRCLSCLKLASKCISPAFRMHMRAHGTVSKIFNLLQDACSDPNLALSTSAIMFMLSRDRLSMDLDHDSLKLMLKLNEVDAGDKAVHDVQSLRDLEKSKQKVTELLVQLQQETHAREIDLGFVSTANLALESLLSLTSRRAGEWFKEELRSVGGLDHIVDSVKFCENSLPEDLSQDIQKALPVLRKLDRCLRVLENISYMSSDNQNYLILYRNAALLQACTRTLRLCQVCMPTHKLLENLDDSKALKDLPGHTLLTCMLDVLRVLLNITHDNQVGNLHVNDEICLMVTVVRCLTLTLWCIPAEQRFDVAVLCLGLLINLVEHNEANCSVLMDMETQVKYTEKSQSKTVSAIKAIVELFVQREQAAREMEEDAEESSDKSAAESSNMSGEWKETDTSIQWITSSLKKATEEQKKVASGAVKEGSVEDAEGNQSILEDEETFTKALHKAGKHMENSIVASYAGLLLGSTIRNNKGYAVFVKKLVPNEDFGPMIKMLKKFLNFMSLTTAFGSTDVNGIIKVIEILESA